MNTRRILIISDDVLPRPGIAGRAAGIRAWSLGQGLIENGLEVRYAVRTQWWPRDQQLPEPRDFEQYWKSSSELEAIIRKAGCKVLLNCSFPNLLPPSAAEQIIIQDSNGPRSIEGVFRRPETGLEAAWREAVAYAHADYFICAGQRQLNYFYPWLALSGFDLTDQTRFAVVRLGHAEKPPARATEAGRLIFTGSLLPWTDPRRAWRVAREEAARAHGLFVLLTSSQAEDHATRFLVKELESYRHSPSCQVIDSVPREQYWLELMKAAAAVDVMEKNCERDLAFPTRSVEYLWTGIPPITNDYSELGELVALYDAGWAVSPADEESIRRAIREALHDRDLVAEKSKNAQRLHDELLHPRNTTRSLAEMCRHATRRPGKSTARPSRLRNILLAHATRLTQQIAGVR